MLLDKKFTSIHILNIIDMSRSTLNDSHYFCILEKILEKSKSFFLQLQIAYAQKNRNNLKKSSLIQLFQNQLVLFIFYL